MKSNKYKELCEQLKALKEVGGEMKGKWEEKNEDINISNYTDRVRNKVREACERKSLTENKPQTREQSPPYFSIVINAESYNELGND